MSSHGQKASPIAVTGRENPSGTWKPDRLLRTLLSWTAVTFLPVWLPLIRGPMDGPSYAWALIPDLLDGRGAGGEYWAVVILAAFALTLLALGWRGARRPFHWLLLLWHLSLGAGAVAVTLQSGDQLRLRGDTMGVDIPLGPAIALLFGGFALLAIWWVVRDLRRSVHLTPPSWTAANRNLLILALALLPVQLLLLRFGASQSLSDQAGVILTMAQWVLINLALVPRAPARPSGTAAP